MKELQQLQAYLDGKKTYIGIAAGVLYSFLIYYKFAQDNALIWTLIATWTGVSYRLAISKASK